MKLKDQTILITGAAGRIGSNIAQEAFKEGAKIIISDVNKVKLNHIFLKLKEKDENRVFTIPTDITKEESINELIKEIINKVGNFQSAVHCAYPTTSDWGTRFENLKSESLVENLSLQLATSIIFSQKILNYFQNQNIGNLIHISSIMGVQSPKFEAYNGTNMHSPVEYTAIKAAIIAITSWLAKYYKNKNIRVNCISPGGILDNQEEVFVNNYRKFCSNIGLLNSSHISSTAIFLLSNDSIAINGQNIIVDDGWSL